MSQTNEGAAAPREVKVSEVLSLLDQGKSRKEIAAYYGQSELAMAQTVWQHPKLKNKKAKKQYSDSIAIVDDTEDEVTETAAPDTTGGEDVTAPADTAEAPEAEATEGNNDAVADTTSEVPSQNGNWEL